MSSGQRITLVAAILGSSVATIDGTIVNVALPAIQRDLGGGLPAQQWVSNAYLLTLGSLILIGGSLGDIYGERRVFAAGVAAFGVLSIVCAAAPTIGVLIAARALQGAAGALLTPSSLAIIVSAFSERERGAAIRFEHRSIGSGVQRRRTGKAITHLAGPAGAPCDYSPGGSLHRFIRKRIRPARPIRLRLRFADGRRRGWLPGLWLQPQHNGL